jgi:hypothetical protein
MYAKVFSQIFDSSIADDYELRHFFMDMLVLADINGVVNMTQEAISARTRIPHPKVSEFLRRLEQPDPRSQSPAENGARIILLDTHRDWGWEIVNYDYYRSIASEEQRRERTKERVRRFRSKGLEDGNAPVTHGNACNAREPLHLLIPVQQEGGVGETSHRLAVRSFQEIERLKRRLEQMYKRPMSIMWDHCDEHQLSDISRRPNPMAELDELEAYRKRNGKFFPMSITALLQGWQKTLDAARNYKPDKPAHGNL